MTTSVPQPGSRRVDVEIIHDVPKTFEEFWAGPGVDANAHIPGVNEKAYEGYLERHQPYRWRAVAANKEVVAHGERYFNLADAINAVELLFGDNTTVYRMPTFGEDRSESLLRYGKTDREHQQ